MESLFDVLWPWRGQIATLMAFLFGWIVWSMERKHPTRDDLKVFEERINKDSKVLEDKLQKELESENKRLNDMEKEVYAIGVAMQNMPTQKDFTSLLLALNGIDGKLDAQSERIEDILNRIRRLENGGQK